MTYFKVFVSGKDDGQIEKDGKELDERSCLKQVCIRPNKSLAVFSFYGLDIFYILSMYYFWL